MGIAGDKTNTCLVLNTSLPSTTCLKVRLKKGTGMFGHYPKRRRERWHSAVNQFLTLGVPSNLLKLKLPGGGQMALPSGILGYGSQMKKMWYLECI